MNSAHYPDEATLGKRDRLECPVDTKAETVRIIKRHEASRAYSRAINREWANAGGVGDLAVERSADDSAKELADLVQPAVRVWPRSDWFLAGFVLGFAVAGGLAVVFVHWWGYLPRP